MLPPMQLRNFCAWTLAESKQSQGRAPLPPKGVLLLNLFWKADDIINGRGRFRTRFRSAGFNPSRPPSWAAWRSSNWTFPGTAAMSAYHLVRSCKLSISMQPANAAMCR